MGIRRIARNATEPLMKTLKVIGMSLRLAMRFSRSGLFYR